jgi:hypothetical protein
MDNITIGPKARSRDTLLGSNEGIVVIKPKTATDVYVVDWQEWDDFRKRTFTPTHTRLTDEEYIELHQVVARTMVPITEHSGNYRKPLVLIGRSLSLDEIQAVHIPPENKKEVDGVEKILE